MIDSIYILFPLWQPLKNNRHETLSICNIGILWVPKGKDKILSHSLLIVGPGADPGV